MNAGSNSSARLRAALDGAAAAQTPALALAVLDAAHAVGPLDDAVIFHHARSRLLVALGRLDDAIVAADRAVVLAPGVPDLGVNLGAALLARFRQSKNRDDLSRARRVLEDALALGPRLPEVRSTLAVVLDQQGESAAALALCDENLRLFPDDPVTLFNKAACLASLGKTQDVRALLETLSTTFPPAKDALARLDLNT